MKQVAPLQYGVMFKKAFCDPEIFTAFVRDFLGIEFEVAHVETERPFDPVVGKFDLYAEENTKHHIMNRQLQFQYTT